MNLFDFESSVKRLKEPNYDHASRPCFIAESMRFDPLVEPPPRKHRRRGLIDPPRHPSDRLVSPGVSCHILHNRHRHPSETVS